MPDAYTYGSETICYDCRCELLAAGVDDEEIGWADDCANAINGVLNCDRCGALLSDAWEAWPVVRRI